MLLQLVVVVCVKVTLKMMLERVSRQEKDQTMIQSEFTQFAVSLYHSPTSLTIIVVMELMMLQSWSVFMS